MIEIKQATRGPLKSTPYWDIFRDEKFILGSQSEAEALERKSTLDANGWTHIDCYRRGFPNPIDWIAHVREKGWTFQNASIEICDDGRTFFAGNIVEYSAAFRYLILDQDLVSAIMKMAPEVQVC